MATNIPSNATETKEDIPLNTETKEVIPSKKNYQIYNTILKNSCLFSFIRHCQSECNVRSWYDYVRYVMSPFCTSVGVAQALQRGDLLCNEDEDDMFKKTDITDKKNGNMVIFCSVLPRAMQTAQLIAWKLYNKYKTPVKVVVIPCIQEHANYVEWIYSFFKSPNMANTIHTDMIQKVATLLQSSFKYSDNVTIELHDEADKLCCSSRGYCMHSRSMRSTFLDKVLENLKYHYKLKHYIFVSHRHYIIDLIKNFAKRNTYSLKEEEQQINNLTMLTYRHVNCNNNALDSTSPKFLKRSNDVNIKDGVNLSDYYSTDLQELSKQAIEYINKVYYNFNNNENKDFFLKILIPQIRERSLKSKLFSNGNYALPDSYIDKIDLYTTTYTQDKDDQEKAEREQAKKDIKRGDWFEKSDDTDLYTRVDKKDTKKFKNFINTNFYKNDSNKTEATSVLKPELSNVIWMIPQTFIAPFTTFIYNIYNHFGISLMQNSKVKRVHLLDLQNRVMYHVYPSCTPNKKINVTMVVRFNNRGNESRHVKCVYCFHTEEVCHAVYANKEGVVDMNKIPLSRLESVLNNAEMLF